MSYTFEPIAVVRSCFKEKFAIPRQAQLVPAAQGILELLPPFDNPQAITGLEQVSHIWLIFVFHQHLKEQARLQVRPPRLGGQTMLGVFASRSPYRPNAIGQSVVKLDKIEHGRLWVSGLDLLDGTPVLDIKPYLPYADSIEAAYNPIAAQAPETIRVTWQASTKAQALLHETRLQQPVIDLITQCLAQDPLPAYQKPTIGKYYGVQILDLQVRWHYLSTEHIEVVEFVPV